MRALTLTVAVAVAVSACKSAESPRHAGAIDIDYGVDAARPRTSFRLHVPPTGDAELTLGAPLSAAGADTLGHFRAPLTAEKRAELAQIVDAHRLLEETKGSPATAEGSGHLRLASGSSVADVPLAGYSPGVSTLRAKLEEIAAEVARHPVRAIRMTMQITAVGATWRPEIVLTQVGTEPLAVLFFDPDAPAFWLRAAATAGPNGPRTELGRADVAALVEAGALPGGVAMVPPGAVFRVPLPPVARPQGASALSGTAELWLPGPGRSRQSMALSASASAP
jgi:hypothetical protein